MEERGINGGRILEDVALLPAHEQVRRVRHGELTATELLQACMERIKRHNAFVNALVTLNENAGSEAAAVDVKIAKGEDPGPLAGLVVGIKDVTETAGIRTTYGSKLFEDFVPDQDATVVKRFRQAGAVIMGKTNTPEFAAGGNTWNEVFGFTRNPWDLDRSAGGSTGGGAAALATGMISIAQGSDLGGSLRIPASFCGIVGLRSTAGLIPTFPSPHLWDHLHVTGTMARTAADIELSLNVLAGPTDESPIAAPPKGRSVRPGELEWDATQGNLAYCPNVAGIGIDPTVASVAEDAVERLRDSGVEIRKIDLDLSYGRDAFMALRGYWFLAQFFEQLDRIAEFGPNVSANLTSGLKVTTRDLGRAENTRRAMREQFLDLFKEYDAVLTPTMAIPPFSVEENYPKTIAGKPMETYIDWMAPTFLLSLPSLPVASVPVGLDSSRLPVGLQVVVPPYRESRALALASLFETKCPIGSPPLVTID